MYISLSICFPISVVVVVVVVVLYSWWDDTVAIVITGGWEFSMCTDPAVSSLLCRDEWQPNNHIHTSDRFLFWVSLLFRDWGLIS